MAKAKLKKSINKAIPDIEAVIAYIKMQCVKGRQETLRRADKDTLLRIFKNIEEAVG